MLSVLDVIQLLAELEDEIWIGGLSDWTQNLIFTNHMEIVSSQRGIFESNKRNQFLFLRNKNSISLLVDFVLEEDAMKLAMTANVRIQYV